MQTITYIGPHDAVDLPHLGVQGLTRFASFPAPDEAAEALLEQPDNFTTGEEDEPETTPGFEDEEL